MYDNAPDVCLRLYIHICDVHITNNIFTNTFYMYFLLYLVCRKFNWNGY